MRRLNPKCDAALCQGDDVFACVPFDALFVDVRWA